IRGGTMGRKSGGSIRWVIIPCITTTYRPMFTLRFKASAIRPTTPKQLGLNFLRAMRPKRAMQGLRKDCPNLTGDSRPGSWRTRRGDFAERLFAAGFGAWKDLARLHEVRAQHDRGDGPPYRSPTPSAKNNATAKRK